MSCPWNKQKLMFSVTHQNTCKSSRSIKSAECIFNPHKTFTKPSFKVFSIMHAAYLDVIPPQPDYTMGMLGTAQAKWVHTKWQLL